MSGYSIVVPLPDQDRSLLMHGYSGTIDIADSQVGEVLTRNRGRALPEGVLEDRTVSDLKSRGYITEKTREEEREFIRLMGETLLRQALNKGREVCLIIPTYDCNLRCTYCYERQVHDHGQAWVSRRMTDGQVDLSIAAARELAGERGVEAFILYGGEPFLPENRDLVEYTVQRIRAEGITVRAVTNGVTLDQFADLLGPDSVSALQITIDGDRETHDRRRPMADGSGSYDRIVENVSVALDKDVTVSLRVNVDTDNLQCLKDVREEAKRRGWLDRTDGRFDIYPATVRYAGDKAVTQTTIWDAVVNEGLGEDICHHGNWFNPLYQAIKHRRLLRYRPFYCTSVISMHIFDPHGDIYPCWDIVGQSEQRVGVYDPSLTIFPSVRQEWESFIGFRRKSCINCRNVLFCGGGCARLTMMKDKDWCQEFPVKLMNDLKEAYLAVTGESD